MLISPSPIHVLPHLFWPMLATILYGMVPPASAIFMFLFVFRYLRLIVHIVGFYLIYKPTPVPSNPTIHRSDCTIIIPTVDPENEGFQECLSTVLANCPGAIIIVTVGLVKATLVESVVEPFRKLWPQTTVTVTQMGVANKRRQVCHALPLVKTKITILVDDHAYWPSVDFLPTILAPFEDPEVGGLGMNKRVRRTSSGWTKQSIFNFWGAVYLERHNFEIRASHAIDGGVFVLSGRTSAHRSCILQDIDFMRGFANEMFFFGKLGPINPDDDNFITRWEVKNGWKVHIQYCEDATMETDLGNPDKYSSQCLRWVRTTWRSNSCSLFTDRVVWRSQPWCVYAIFITSFSNFALFYDMALMYTLSQTAFGDSWLGLSLMALWIFWSKMVKLIPHFVRCPQDIQLIPTYLFFAYWHSFIKLYALFTFWDVKWEGRNLAAIELQAVQETYTDKEEKD